MVVKSGDFSGFFANRNELPRMISSHVSNLVAFCYIGRKSHIKRQRFTSLLVQFISMQRVKQFLLFCFRTKTLLQFLSRSSDKTLIMTEQLERLPACAKYSKQIRFQQRFKVVRRAAGRNLSGTPIS